jgi:hypothetical protein
VLVRSSFCNSSSLTGPIYSRTEISQPCYALAISIERSTSTCHPVDSR